MYGVVNHGVVKTSIQYARVANFDTNTANQCFDGQNLKDSKKRILISILKADMEIIQTY